MWSIGQHLPKVKAGGGKAVVTSDREARDRSRGAKGCQLNRLSSVKAKRVAALLDLSTPAGGAGKNRHVFCE